LNFKNIYTKVKCYYGYKFRSIAYYAFSEVGSTASFEIVLVGGLGDIILGTQFINEIKRNNPNCHLKLYYRDDDSLANPVNFSWGSTRKYASLSGEMNNPIREWVNCFYVFDEAIGCDIDKIENVTRFYPPQLGVKQGYSLPNEYNEKYLESFFQNFSLRNKAFDIYSELSDIRDRGSKIICLHLRRNANKVLDFANHLQHSGIKCHFILLGSSEHQSIPDISGLINTTNLIDSYSKGLNTIELLKITRQSDLFIGGRGGFELFHWLSEVPSINFFDPHGMIEVSSYLWPESLWKENIINKLFNEKSENNKIEAKYLSKIGW